MAVIVTRAGKGSPLTNNEVDANFINLNTELGLKASAGANSDITSMSGITGGISTADYLDIDTAATPAGAVGRLKWSATEAGPEIGMGGGNVTLQIGQEELVYVLNKTGTAFTDMQVVRVIGAQGNRLEVALAQASDDTASASSLAVVTEPIADNQQGFATRGGLVNNVNTLAFAEGAALWLSPTVPGGITTTKPTAPAHLVLVGWCVRSHATVGSIFVHIQNGYELDELHNVLITTPTNDQVLQYESATSLWKNKTLVTLPSQTGNSGKFLTTDGTNASWATVDLTAYLEKSGGTMTGAITFAAGQTWPTFNQNTTGSAATLTTARTIAITGDLTYTSGSFDGSANVTGVGTLAASGVTAGSYTTANITVDAKGRVTAASSGAGGGGVTSITGTASQITASASTGAVTLSLPATINVNTSGNAATATALSSGSTNWSGTGVLGNVVGMLAWKNYANNHVIFDASAGTAPNGTTISNTNAQSGWAASFPTLMGWNGSNTYGVRVDAARYSESCTGNAATATTATTATTANALNTSNNYVGQAFYAYNWFRTYGSSGWYNESYGGGMYMIDATYVRTYGGKQFYCDSTITAGGNVVANSDETLKTNWRDLPADFVEQLAKVKHGTYDRLDIDLTQDGVSAQSLQPLLPSSVSMGANDKLTVAYGNAALVSAVQLAQRVVEQDERIARLEALVAKLNKKETP